LQYIDTAMLWFFGDIISHAVGLIIKKYGQQDQYGVDLGFGKDEIYQLLEENQE
jgi:hypothetical protein